ncbi:MAG: tetratricopeptide repeat protein [Gemmatimonadales bacterium]
MTVKQAVGVVLAIALGAAPARGQIAGKWVGEKCGLRPGHSLVNDGMRSLKDAVETRLEDQKQKKLTDALRDLTQALTTGEQQDNAAAWYYLGRYYMLVDDAAGGDSAFTRAQQLHPECADDIGFWRQSLWVPVFNAGVAAWQAGNTDSAIMAFTRANLIYRDEPNGPIYLAILHANADQVDSAIKYFHMGIAVAGDDTTYRQEKKEAQFNLARMYHRSQQWDQAAPAYRDYLTRYPGDPEATAALAAVFSAAGQRDSATVLYRSVLDRADSVTFLDLFQAGVSIYRGAPSFPDTGAASAKCREETPGTAAVKRRRCRAVTDSVVRAYAAESREIFSLAARAFQAVLGKNPFYRDALYNLSNTYYQMRDTANMLPVSRRLIQVDPMNRTSNLLVAQAYQMRGMGDSALYYLQVSDSILPVEVNITELALDEQQVAVGGLITNFHDKQSASFVLEFEFLNAQGAVLATRDYRVPAIEAQGNEQFRVEVPGTELTGRVSAYRYRPKA